MIDIALTVAVFGFAITATLIGFMIAGRFVLIPYLYFQYDAPIQKLESEFENLKQKINEDAVGRGVTAGGLEPHIAGPESIMRVKVTSLELRRRHFLDRANLFLSISSLR